MAVKVNDILEDGMKEACERLNVSRSTLLRYIKEGIVTDPPRTKQGRTKYRYFPEAWYRLNEAKVKAL